MSGKIMIWHLLVILQLGNLAASLAVPARYLEHYLPGNLSTVLAPIWPDCPRPTAQKKAESIAAKLERLEAGKRVGE